MIRRSPLRIAAAFTAFTIWWSFAAPRAARADSPSELTYKVEAGDTFELLAAEYYGDRRHAAFLLVANSLDHARPLKPGEIIRIPISREHTAKAGDTFATIAAAYLGDARRAKYLAEFNGVAADESIAAGHVITVPFHVVHRAAAKESLESIAAAYFGKSSQAKLLRGYNYLTKDSLDKGETIVIPIHHVRVRASKLPAPDAESRARADKRRMVQERVADALPRARSAWNEGDFSTVKRILTAIDLDYLDAAQAADVGVLLGATYIAFNDKDSAKATFKKVLERRPSHELSTYDHSPKVLNVWRELDGKIK